MICSKCKEDKPESEFYRRRDTKKGYGSHCKSCCSKWAAENQDSIKKARQKWLDSNYEKARDSQRKYKITNREKLKKDYRNWRLKNQYGLTEEDFKELLIKQNGVCAICGQSETKVQHGKIQPLTVDHNHETGKVRGLLCFNCNIAIGKLKDSVVLLEQAIEYLKGESN
jgi:hypothetical protein